MKFNDLSDQEKIQSIKDNFVLILEQLATDPKKLEAIFKIEKPKTISPSFEKLTLTMSDEVRATTEKKNKELEETVREANIKAEKEYNDKLAVLEAAKITISKLRKKEGCLCGSCLDMDIANKGVPSELEVLIDVARKEAEERVY
jgi:hypothetical protein